MGKKLQRQISEAKVSKMQSYNIIRMPIAYFMSSLLEFYRSSPGYKEQKFITKEARRICKQKKNSPKEPPTFQLASAIIQ